MPANSGCQFYVWAILVSLVLALVISLIFNISHCLEKQRQGKIYRYPEDYIPREDEYYVEDTPIYGNLDNVVVPEPTDENCYEQMKARPERSVNELQEAAPPAQAIDETQMFYAQLNHNCEGKRRKPRKNNTYLEKNEDELPHGTNTSLSKTSLVDSFPPNSQAVEENIHDDPVRLFGLIRAKREPVN